MFRSTWMLILTLVLFGSVELRAQKDPQITVVVYNDAAIPERLIKSAKETAGRIYRDAGIAIV